MSRSTIILVIIGVCLSLGLCYSSPNSASAASAPKVIGLEYTGADQALMGLNGVVTSPIDILAGVVQGDGRLGEPRFVAPVTNRVVGVFTGIFTSAHRFTFGLADLVLAVFPVTHVSPDPAVVVIPGAPTISEPPPGFPGS